LLNIKSPQIALVICVVKIATNYRNTTHPFIIRTFVFLLVFRIPYSLLFIRWIRWILSLFSCYMLYATS